MVGLQKVLLALNSCKLPDGEERRQHVECLAFLPISFLGFYLVSYVVFYVL